MLCCIKPKPKKNAYRSSYAGNMDIVTVKQDKDDKADESDSIHSATKEDGDVKKFSHISSKRSDGKSTTIKQEGGKQEIIIGSPIKI